MTVLDSADGLGPTMEAKGISGIKDKIRAVNSIRLWTAEISQSDLPFGNEASTAFLPSPFFGFSPPNQSKTQPQPPGLDFWAHHFATVKLERDIS